MSTCPAGHESAADDYCDVCGLPIGEAGAASPPVEPAAAGDAASDAAADAEPAAPAEDTGAPKEAICPNCQAVNPQNALFCEACGFDFTTGQTPRPAPSVLDLGVPDDGSAPSVPLYESLADTNQPTAETPAVPDSIAPPLDQPWMAEVWIDPDWYAEQSSSDPLPSAGVPVVVPLKRKSILVGRTSRSRNIHPDIDLTSDNGISRRHCQFTTDGSRWWVEDLGSSNGTYVGSPLGPLPADPLPAGEKKEIAPDDRIYLGAWTRIVIRRATSGEG